MLSMETCISPDGRTISYGVQQSCASLGLDKYHWWQMEPFHHISMWLQTPAGDVTAMMVIIGICILVMDARRHRMSAERTVDLSA